MCIRDSLTPWSPDLYQRVVRHKGFWQAWFSLVRFVPQKPPCLLYTSDAADERSSVDLGGRRIIKKQNHVDNRRRRRINKKTRKYQI